MKTFLASLLAAVGLSSAPTSAENPTSIDPQSILFSIPTISNDLAPVEPVHGQLGASDFAFHEDEWCQVEFFSKDRLTEIQQLLKEYKPFEASNRVKSGWRNTYVRKIERMPVVAGHNPVGHLENELGASAGPAPILFSSNTITGRIKNGFSLALGGNVTLYGYTSPNGIPVLGALIGKNPDDRKLTDAFIKLNRKDGLLLVDWRQQLVLVAVEPNGQLQAWRP